MLVGLCGYAGSGKDTAALGLTARGWEQIAFADALKEVARAIGWDGRKDNHGRVLLQRLGVAVRDHVDPDAWVHPVATFVYESASPVVVTDVRFPNEIEWIKSEGGALVRVDRPGFVAANDHISEHAWRDARFNAVIVNDGSPEEIGHKLWEVANR